MSLRGVLLSRNNIWRFLKSWRKLDYVIGMTTWSFYWDAFYLVRELQKNFRLNAHISYNPQNARNKLLHFGDRYVFLDVFCKTIHPSNRIFLTWFHGDPGDTDNGFDRLFARLQETQKQIERIVVPCRITYEALESAGIPSEQLALIPLGVDLTVFRPAHPYERTHIRKALGIPEYAFCIGSFQKDGIGWDEGMEPKLIKGPDIFIETINTLYRSYPDIFVLLTGPARGYVKKLLTKIGVPFVHTVLHNYHDIAAYYGALDLCLITSRCEGGPKALLESWACAVPVVATQVGMAADCIEHCRNGMVVPLDRVATLADCVAELHDNPQLRQQIIHAAHATVQQFDWACIAAQYYRELYRAHSAQTKSNA